jgi:hypothetical protein
MLRPIAPFVEYAINYDYISKVLCINKEKPEMSCKGKCQLMKKIEQQQENDYQSLRISMEEYPIGFVNVLKIDDSIFFSFLRKKIISYSYHYSYLFHTTVFHPPTI